VDFGRAMRSATANRDSAVSDWRTRVRRPGFTKKPARCRTSSNS
jgi:hypothetical protein